MFSMTAFARHRLETEFVLITCEIRSVNHRFLDIQCRLPELLREHENDLRDLVKKELARGKVEVLMNVSMTHKAALGELNIPLANQLIENCQELSKIWGEKNELSVLDLLNWPGVLMETNMPAHQLKEPALTLLGETLAKLIENRKREGETLKQMMSSRLQQIQALLPGLRAIQSKIVSIARDKLKTKIDDLTLDFDNARLEQEVILVAQRADISEEIDRLQCHIEEASHLLEKQGPVGRQLDFLMQEFNREANTLASKSNQIKTTNAAVEIKVLVEQLREQIQNIE